MSSTVLHENVTVADKAGNVSTPEPEEARDSELAKVEVAVQVSG